MKAILVPVSPGELLDKISILELKAERIGDAEKVHNARVELAELRAAWWRSPWAAESFDGDVQALRTVNSALWDIEDALRKCERESRFDWEFLELARSVYRRNDERAAIKRRINVRLGSTLIEEKGYS